VSPNCPRPIWWSAFMLCARLQTTAFSQGIVNIYEHNLIWCHNVGKGTNVSSTHKATSHQIFLPFFYSRVSTSTASHQIQGIELLQTKSWCFPLKSMAICLLLFFSCLWGFVRRKHGKTAGRPILGDPTVRLLYCSLLRLWVACAFKICRCQAKFLTSRHVG